MRASETCPVCGSAAVPAAERYGRFAGRIFHVHRCESCGFVFVADPWTEYEAIYDRDYYLGKGADPLVNYLEEASDPRSLRRYEWRGIESWVASVTTLERSTRWLDFGAGSGGLVSYLRERGYAEAFGYDQSAAVPRVAGYESFALESLDPSTARFDVITAIEVIEHIPDPVAVLRHLHELLVPGGLLFLTTTNSGPYKKRLGTWRYIVPEIHVSFFDPPALATALRSAGFEPFFPGYVDGWTDIVRYKLLKNLGLRRTSAVHQLIPWSLVSRLVDAQYQLSAQPVGRAQHR